jgi:hypothetical protein
MSRPGGHVSSARNHPEAGIALTYIAQTVDSTPDLNADGGDRYTGMDRFGRVIDQNWYQLSTTSSTDRFQYGYDADSNVLYKDNRIDRNQSELYHTSGSSYGYARLGRWIDPW